MKTVLLLLSMSVSSSVFASQPSKLPFPGTGAGDTSFGCDTVTIDPQTGASYDGYIRAQLYPSPTGQLKVALDDDETTTTQVRAFPRYSKEEVRDDRVTMAVVDFLKIDADQVGGALGLLVEAVAKPSAFLVLLYDKDGHEIGRGGYWEHLSLFFACKKPVGVD